MQDTIITPELPDQVARKHAVDIRQSCVVSAPAGSGKTGLLTQRVLTLLGAVKKPEEILCITFTRKAANEMRERVFDVLTHAATLDSSDIQNISNSYERERTTLAKKALQQSEKHEWDLLNNKYRLKILTIDGFCKSLSSRLPFLSSMGINAGIFDDANGAYKEAVSSWLMDKVTKNNPEIKQLATLFDGNMNRITELLSSLLSVREQWLPLTVMTQQNVDSARDYFEGIIAEMVAETIDDVSLCLQDYEGDLCAIAQFAAQQLCDAGSDSPITALRDADAFADNSDQSIQTFWLPLCQILLTNDGSFRKTANKNIGFPAGTNSEEKKLFKEKKQQLLQIIGELKELPNSAQQLHALRSLPQQTFSDLQWETLKQIIDVLPELVAYLKVTFAKYKKADFTEYTLAALRALKGIDGDLALQQRFDYQLQHILIDEFQDTSQPQLDLLNLLTQEWQPDDGKTVFVVGDGMQSCYAFRNANVGIFLNTKDKGLPAVALTPLDLSVNFRSDETIVNWVNTTFTQLFPEYDNASKGAVRYSPSVAFHTKQESIHDIHQSTVTCRYFPQAKDEKTDKTRATAESLSIAHTIQNYREADETQTIAILAKTRSQFASVVDALSQYKIPYIAIDIDPLLSKKTILDLLNLTKVIVDPSDRVAWISLLRSPWCALNFHDLTLLAHTDLGALNPKCKTTGFAPLYIQIQHAEHIHNLHSKGSSTKGSSTKGFSTEGLHALKHMRTALLQVLEQRQRRTLAACVETAWAQLGGAYTLDTESDLDDIRTFLQRIDHFDNAGTIESWEAFYQDIQKLYAQPASTDTNPVQLLTMHKSKGLEFDTVFLPSLEKTGRNDDPELLYWHEHLNADGDTHFILSPIDIQSTDDTNKSQNSISKYIRQIKKEKSDLETIRLLYVACTRAKKNLHVSATLKVDDNNDVIAPAKNSLLAKIWPSLASEFTLSTHDIDIQNSHAQQTISTNDANFPYIRRLNFTKIQAHARSQQIDTTHTADDDSTLFNQKKNIEHSIRNVHTKTALGAFNNKDFDLETAYQSSHMFERNQGIFIHRLLNTLCISDLSTWHMERVNKTQAHWQAQLAQMGLSTQQANNIIVQAIECIETLRKNDTAQWIFDASHRHSACELSLWWQGEEKIIDRTFIDKDVRWIIDYKTSTPANTALPVFLHQEKETYQEQMQGYEAILREYDKTYGIEGIDNKLTYKKALYFPFIAELTLYNE